MDDEKKSWRTKVVIVTVLILAAVGWMTLFDRVWPSEAHAVICEDTYCEYPGASKRLNRKYKRDKMWRSHERSIEWVVNRSARRKIIRAYKNYTETHSYAEAASPGLKAQSESAAQVMGMAAPTDWPSPGDWWRTFKGSGKCLWVGAIQTYRNAVCAVSYANDGTYFKKMARKSRLALNEATRVTIKCGGAAVLGGLTKEGKGNIAKAFGVGVRGGWGMAAFGAGCLWGEYFNRWSPW